MTSYFISNALTYCPYCFITMYSCVRLSLLYIKFIKLKKPQTSSFRTIHHVYCIVLCLSNTLSRLKHESKKNSWTIKHFFITHFLSMFFTHTSKTTVPLTVHLIDLAVVLHTTCLEVVFSGKLTFMNISSIVCPQHPQSVELQTTPLFSSKSTILSPARYRPACVIGSLNYFK